MQNQSSSSRGQHFEHLEKNEHPEHCTRDQFEKLENASILSSAPLEFYGLSPPPGYYKGFAADLPSVPVIVGSNQCLREGTGGDAENFGAEDFVPLNSGQGPSLYDTHQNNHRKAPLPQPLTALRGARPEGREATTEKDVLDWTPTQLCNDGYNIAAGAAHGLGTESSQVEVPE